MARVVGCDWRVTERARFLTAWSCDRHVDRCRGQAPSDTVRMNTPAPFVLAASAALVVGGCISGSSQICVTSLGQPVEITVAQTDGVWRSTSQTPATVPAGTPLTFTIVSDVDTLVDVVELPGPGVMVSLPTSVLAEDPTTVSVTPLDDGRITLVDATDGDILLTMSVTCGERPSP